MSNLMRVPAGSRFFPRKREFYPFSARNRRLAAKTVRQIKPLPANSRSATNREFARLNREFNSPNRELSRKKVEATASEIQLTRVIVPRQLAFYEADQSGDHGASGSGGGCGFPARCDG
jgi:hypothetical protein